MAFSLSFSLLMPGRDSARLQEKTVNWASPIHQQGTMKFVEISLIISIPNHTERTRQRTRQSTFPISALINSRPALSARPFLIPFRRKISHQLPRADQPPFGRPNSGLGFVFILLRHSNAPLFIVCLAS